MPAKMLPTLPTAEAPASLALERLRVLADLDRRLDDAETLLTSLLQEVRHTPPARPTLTVIASPPEGGDDA